MYYPLLLSPHKVYFSVYNKDYHLVVSKGSSAPKRARFLFLQFWLMFTLPNLRKKGRFCNNSKFHTLISKRLSVKEQSKTLSTGSSKHLLCSIVYSQFPVERVSLCSLQIFALKLACQCCYCHKSCPCCTWQLSSINKYANSSRIPIPTKRSSCHISHLVG